MFTVKIGIGHGNIEDSFLLGQSVARNALENGPLKQVDQVITFCSGQVNPQQYLAGIRQIIGPKPQIIGGAAGGIITNNYLSYQGHPAAGIFIESNDFFCAYSDAVASDSKRAGRNFAKQFSTQQNISALLFFYDSLKQPASDSSPPQLNASQEILNGIASELSPTIPVFGAGLLGDFHFHSSFQFFATKLIKDSIVGAAIKGPYQPFYRIMHGCIPMDGTYYTITKMNNDIIYELDNRPIVEVINNLYQNTSWQQETPNLHLSIGVNHGSRYGEFKEKNYVTRLILGMTPDKKGIHLFETDLTEGTEIQFMLRNGHDMCNSTRLNTESLIKNIQKEDCKPIFAFYIDCAGRSALISDTLEEEASYVQKMCNQHNIPLIGIYSGVEIAPFLGKSRGLDLTGVLIIIASRQ